MSPTEATGPVPEPEPDPDRPTLAPFLGAFAVFALIVLAIVGFDVFGSQTTTPGDQVARAAVGQNDALQRTDFGAYTTFTCRSAAGTEADFLARQRDSVAKDGQRFLDDVTDIRIDGDRATATVTYHFDKTPDTKTPGPVSFLQEDGAWKVCPR